MSNVTIRCIGFQAPITIVPFSKPPYICQNGKQPKFSTSRPNSLCIVCRLRNRGGFQSPPSIPHNSDQQQRAIELLGCFTQTTHLHHSKLHELENLIGQVPKNRLIAQQWKDSLRRQKRKNKSSPNHIPFSRINQMMETIKFPKNDKALSVCFSMLEHVRRQYQNDRIPLPRTIAILTSTLGSCPTSVKEAQRYIRILALKQKERRSKERRPPTIPTGSIDDMYYVSMLLGTYAVKGSIGKQKQKLENLIGALPRTSNIAASWKKHVEAAIRKKKRRDKAAAKAIEVEAKREHRRRRRLMREQQQIHSSSDTIVTHSDALLTQNTPLNERAVAVTNSFTIALTQNDVSQTSKLSLLCKFIGRLFKGS